MPPRVALALFTLCACAVAAVAGVFLASAQTGEPTTAAVAPNGFAGAIRPPGTRMPAATLRDQDGRSVTLDRRREGPVVVTFVYATCEDTCPAQVQAIRGALDEYGRDVPVLGISVDPANDTAARAKRFVNEQRMTGRMRFLLGSEAELAGVWRAFGIAPQRGAEDHSAYTVIVDGAGRQRIGFPFSGLTSDGLAQDLARLS